MTRAARRASGPVRHKYGAVAVVRDGQRFDSKLEAAFFDHLQLLQRSGEVVGFLRQVPFHLPGNVRYVCDFLVFWADGTVTFDDPKGKETDLYRLKRSQVQALYPWATVRALKRERGTWVAS